MKNFKKISIVILFSLIIAFSLSGCSQSDEGRMWLQTPGWGWGQNIGTATYQKTPLAFDDNGIVYMFFVSKNTDNERPTIRSIDRNNEIVWESYLDVPQARALDLQILVDNQTLWLFWRADASLYQAKLDLNGNVISLPASIETEIEVADLDAVISLDGEITVWYSGPRKQPGLYSFNPTFENQPHSLIDAFGVRPSLVYDQNNDLHALWAYYPYTYGAAKFNYAVSTSGKIEIPDILIVHTFPVLPGVILEGPYLGVDSGYTYVFWTNNSLTGRSAGDIETNYISFPLGEGGLSRPNRIRVPEAARPEYQEIDSAELQIGSVAQFDQPGRFVDLSEISTSSQVQEDLVIGYQAKTMGGWNISNKEVGTILFTDGHPTYYQVVSRSEASSSFSSIASDLEGNIYMTWMEPNDEDQRSIFFATTSEDIQNAMGQPTVKDVTPMLWDALFGITVGLIISPLAALFWMIVPLATYWLTAKLRPSNYEKNGKIGAVITLGIIIFEYWVIKYSMLNLLNGVDQYVPFSRWIPAIPVSWTQLLQFGVPALILLISLVLAWNFSYRKDSDSNLTFTIFYIGIDAALTMSVYGVLIYEIV